MANGKIYNDKKNVSITPLDIYNLYPVGSIYISVINTNPSTYFGGTWEAFGAGRCLVGVDALQTEFNTVLKTGGEKMHKLVISEMPSHNHPMGVLWGQKTGYGRVTGGNPSTGADRANIQGSDVSTGGNQAHNNLQPYITVYMWRRIS